ncbi:hypothetical protein CEXT_705071 [Caerostris extrusa]|uniref:Uncharacterized protein n=1 Tax=Caerostris extrusa TaxID=172846 RepID=A0AAV4SE16_CAEEX|nr:hypothetical protein CEXT_705071 [Caerostris extrusa]
MAREILPSEQREREIQKKMGFTFRSRRVMGETEGENEGEKMDLGEKGLFFQKKRCGWGKRRFKTNSFPLLERRLSVPLAREIFPSEQRERETQRKWDLPFDHGVSWETDERVEGRK